MALILKTNGTTEELNDLALTALQQAVGGSIEGVRTRDHRLLYINEEGKLLGLPLNVQATVLYRNGAYDPIVGDAVLFTFEETRAEREE